MTDPHPVSIPVVVDSAATVVVMSDDQSVIDAIGDAHGRHASVWNVVHASGDDELLELMSTLERLDMIVVQSAIDGRSAGILDRVRRRSPHTARVVLCDPSDRTIVTRLAALAHQVLPTPLDVDVLSDLVERVRRSARTGLSDPVRTLVGQTDRLPSPPTMFQRLNQILASDDWRLADLVDEISQDAALTGEILKLVNSSFYGTANRVTAIGQAISMIGAKQTRFIVLGNTVFQSNGGFETWVDLERLARRSRTVASGARALAARDGGVRDVGASAYLAGLVSEIGLLVLARLPGISPSIAAPVNNSVFLAAERVLFGGDRFEVGARLLTLWGFDDVVIDAVASLSTGDPTDPGEVAWYLTTARHLVVDLGLDPDSLARPVGSDPEVDRAIDDLHGMPIVPVSSVA